MRILQVSKFYPPYKGGIELVAEMYSRAHQKLGDQVDVISFGETNDHYTGEFREKVTQLKKHLFLLSTPFNFSILFNPFKIFKKDYDIVYVHLHNPFIHVWFLVWSFLFKIDGSRLYGIYHSDLSNQGRLGDLYEFFFQKTSFIYDELIVSSPKLHQYSSVISKFQKVNIIPFPVKINNEYKVRNHFHGNIVAIGRLVPYKGFEFLIKAVSKTDLKLKIIGDGPLRTELEELSKSFSNITLCGNITDEDKDKIIAESDLLVVSSINKAEAYGMIIVEAFQSGLPVIASNIDTGVTFLVQDGVTGLVFDVLNEQSLISKLEELKEEKKMEKLSSGAYEFYLNNLTFSKFTENINRLRVSKN